MPRPRSSVPPYEFHKSTGRAYVRLRQPDGGRKTVYIGKYNTPESRAEYGRIVAELTASKLAVRTVPTPGSDVTVNEILLAFWRHAEQHYRRADGTQTNELAEYKYTLRAVKELYGHTVANEFGPLALKAVRQKLLDGGLSRGVINARIGRVKRIFKWAASEQLIPAKVFLELTTVTGLKRGRTTAWETEPVKPVPIEDATETAKFVLPAVSAMIEVQKLTGMRPQDVCGLHSTEVDRSGPVWWYRPGQHKTAWRGMTRSVPMGPQAQAVLTRFWPTDCDGYFFSPAKEIAAMHAARTAARVTPGKPQFRFRVKNPTRKPGKCYTTSSYDKAIRRGVDLANAAAAQHDAPKGHHGPNLPRIPHWSPNQLRHAYATEIRKKFGLEAAQVLLGHARADVTQVYAERNAELGERVALEVG